MADVTSQSAALTHQRALALFAGNVKRVGDAVKGGMFAPAVEAACRLVVNESRRYDRPLAWNDVTGNLRASISFQVEHYIGADPTPSLRDPGVVYNTIKYVSGLGSGVNGVVYAPPEYAVNVEMKSTRSVLLEPVATTRDALFRAMGNEAAKNWAGFVIRESVLRGSSGGASA